MIKIPDFGFLSVQSGRGRLEQIKPVPKRTFAMFPGTQTNFKYTVVQEMGSKKKKNQKKSKMLKKNTISGLDDDLSIFPAR